MLAICAECGRVWEVEIQLSACDLVLCTNIPLADFSLVLGGMATVVWVIESVSCATATRFEVVNQMFAMISKCKWAWRGACRPALR